MKKIHKVILCLCLLTIITTGCKAEENTDYTFSSEEVAQISIRADGQNVELAPTQADDVKASMVSKDEWTAVLKDGMLIIEVPSPSDMINIKTHTLRVELPDKIYNKIELVTTSGKVTVDNIQAAALSAETDSGNISIGGMEGVVDAQTNSGKIKSSLPISSEIVPEGAGYALKGTIGTNLEDSSEIKLYSVSGTISID